jgi:hypothetical protein
MGVALISISADLKMEACDCCWNWNSGELKAPEPEVRVPDCAVPMLYSSVPARLIVFPVVCSFRNLYSQLHYNHLAKKYKTHLKFNHVNSYKDFTFNSVGGDSEQLLVRFSRENDEKSLRISFNNLSDGEKCMFLGALVTAANEYYGPLLCFWDEPDNYLALREIEHFIVALRRAFSRKGQLIVTSHNIEAIERFSDENTLSLQRASHLEPVVVKRLSETRYSSLYDAIKSGEI